MLDEAGAITVLLGSILAAQLAVSGSFGLFRRNLWLDEIVTDVLVSDRDIAHSLRAIVGGLDTNPPGYHLLLRMWRMLVGGATEARLRAFSWFSVLAALVGLYLQLREVYAPLTALAAVLAVWSHPLGQRCAFEARMYGTWLAATVWFSYAANLSWNAPTNVRLQVLVVCTSILTCALHTLGALALVLVLSAQMLFHDSSQWSTLTLASGSAGLILFLAWLPLLRKQNLANPVTWVNAPTRQHVAEFARSFLFPRHLATVLLLGGGFAAFLGGPWTLAGTPAGASRDPASLAGLAGLILMPIGLVILSALLQPLLVERYATPAVASCAPAIASVVSPLPAPWTAALCGVLFVIGAVLLSDLRATYGVHDRRTAALVQAIDEHAGEAPLFFESLRELCVVSRYARQLATRCFVLDYDNGELSRGDAVRMAGRNHARLLSRFYPEFAVRQWQDVQTLPRFYLVPVTHPTRTCVELEMEYAGFSAIAVGSGLYLLTARGDLGSRRNASSVVLEQSNV